MLHGTADAPPFRHGHAGREGQVRKLSAGRGRVLIVEDEPELGQTIRRTLRSHGYQAEVLADGIQVLARLQDGDIAAVVMDLRLRDIRGCDLLQEIRRLSEFTPTVTYLGVPDQSPEMWFQPTTVFCVMLRRGNTGHLLESVSEACRAVPQAHKARCTWGRDLAGPSTGKEAEAIRTGYWWIEGLLGAALVAAPFVGKFTMLHLEAYTDVTAGILLVVWALVGYWHVDGIQDQGAHPAHL
jgi:hypothetical protein